MNWILVSYFRAGRFNVAPYLWARARTDKYLDFSRVDFAEWSLQNALGQIGGKKSSTSPGSNSRVYDWDGE